MEFPCCYSGSIYEWAGNNQFLFFICMAKLSGTFVETMCEISKQFLDVALRDSAYSLAQNIDF